MKIVYTVLCKLEKVNSTSVAQKQKLIPNCNANCNANSNANCNANPNANTMSKKTACTQINNRLGLWADNAIALRVKTHLAKKGEVNVHLLEQSVHPYKNNPIFPYFMGILIISHLFLSYLFLTELYFIPILPHKKNRAPILFIFYFIIF